MAHVYFFNRNIILYLQIRNPKMSSEIRIRKPWTLKPSKLNEWYQDNVQEGSSDFAERCRQVMDKIVSFLQTYRGLNVARVYKVSARVLKFFLMNLFNIVIYIRLFGEVIHLCICVFDIISPECRYEGKSTVPCTWVKLSNSSNVDENSLILFCLM